MTSLPLKLGIIVKDIVFSEGRDSALLSDFVTLGGYNSTSELSFRIAEGHRTGGAKFFLDGKELEAGTELDYASFQKVKVVGGTPDHFTVIVKDSVNEARDRAKVEPVEELNEVRGTHGSDFLNGTDNADLIKAKHGDDKIYAGGGNDTVHAGHGDDVIYGDASTLVRPTLSETDANYYVVPGGDDTIYAGHGNDTVYASSGNDVVYGGHGNDTLNGEGGDDTLRGGYGDDTLNGGAGNDFLSGGFGDDIIYGDSNREYSKPDVHSGGWCGTPPIWPAPIKGGDDIIHGGFGNDTVYGGYGNDFIHGGHGDDTLNGESGDDEIRGGAGNDVINGGYGNDTIHGGKGNDTIYGGLGDDEIRGGTGDDVIYGDDTFFVYDRPQPSGIDGDEWYCVLPPIWPIPVQGGNDIINAGSGNDTVYGGAGDDIIHGGAGDDTLHGESGDDIINGGSGEDTINGGSGDDILRGGDGNDVITGGSGDDILHGGSGKDQFVFNGKEGGIDTVLDFEDGLDQLIFNFVLGPNEANISNEVLTQQVGNDLLVSVGGIEVLLEDMDIEDFDRSDYQINVTPNVPRPQPYCDLPDPVSGDMTQPVDGSIIM